MSTTTQIFIDEMRDSEFTLFDHIVFTKATCLSIRGLHQEWDWASMEEEKKLAGMPYYR